MRKIAIIFIQLVLPILCFLIPMAAIAQGLDPQPVDSPTFIDLLKMNWGIIVISIWEIVTRLVPGWEDRTFLKTLGTLIDLFVPNRSQNGSILVSEQLNKRAIKEIYQGENVQTDRALLSETDTLILSIWLWISWPVILAIVLSVVGGALGWWAYVFPGVQWLPPTFLIVASLALTLYRFR